MLVSHKKKFIFVHIYKNAGTSIENALQAYAASKLWRGVYHISNNLGISKSPIKPCDQHAKADEIRAIVGDEVYSDYFSFAFVRNPWDWQVSLYKYSLKKEDHFQHDFIQSLGSFDAYIEWRCNNEVELQKNFILADSGESLVDFIGRFENLEDDFSKICSQLNISAKLPRLKVSNTVPYQNYYSEFSKKLVAETYAEDIDRFRYEF